MYKKNINIASEIKTIITAMTAEHDIISISEVNDKTEIKTDTIKLFDNLGVESFLLPGMIIGINNINYEVESVLHEVENDTIIINQTGITGDKWKLAANFKTGTRTEINQILEQESGGLNRFPLIWLIQPISQDFNHNLIDFSANLILVFAHKSNQTDRAEKRLNENITKVLNPLFDLFRKWLQSSEFNHMFEFEGYGKPIEFQQNIYPFYGTSDKRKNVLNTFTDAIEVSANLKFKKQFIN